MAGKFTFPGSGSSARTLSSGRTAPILKSSTKMNPVGSSSSTGSSTSADALSKQLLSIQASNNAWSAQQAQRQMDFQQASAREAMQFNHNEAELSRQWQQWMSDTSHQREIKDLQAAGLNPVLSVMGGGGAPVTSGATASGYAPQGAKGDTDTSLSGALVSLFGSMLSSQTALANQAVSARSNEAIADKYTSMSKLVAEIQRDTTLSAANISAAASQYSADRHVDASYLSAQISAAAQRYGHDLSAMTQRQIAAFNADVNRELAQRGYEHDFDIREAFPTNAYGLLNSLIGQSSGNKGLSGAISSAKDALKSYFDKVQSSGPHKVEHGSYGKFG